MTRAEERPLERVFKAAQKHSRYQNLFCAIVRSMNIISLTSSGCTPTLLSKDFLSISQHGLRPFSSLNLKTWQGPASKHGTTPIAIHTRKSGYLYGALRPILPTANVFCTIFHGSRRDLCFNKNMEGRFHWEARETPKFYVSRHGISANNNRRIRRASENMKKSCGTNQHVL